MRSRNSGLSMFSKQGKQVNSSLLSFETNDFKILEQRFYLIKLSLISYTNS